MFCYRVRSLPGTWYLCRVPENRRNCRNSLLKQQYFSRSMTILDKQNMKKEGESGDQDSSLHSNDHNNDQSLIDTLLITRSKNKDNAAETKTKIPQSLEEDEEYDFEDEIIDRNDYNTETRQSSSSTSFTRFWKEHCGLFLPMAGWFIFSVCLSLYNKFVFGKNHMHFPCPLLLTSIHFLSQWVFSWSMTEMFPKRLGGDDVRGMNYDTFLGVSIPCGLVTSTDIGLSNLALVRISMTFYTMVKASSPIFVVASAFLFGIEPISCTLLVVVAVICCGEFLTVFGEMDFDLLGFVLCGLASVCSGLRWTLVQSKLSKLDPPLRTTIATMRVLSPSMFGSMLILTLAIEQPWNTLQPFFDSGGSLFQLVGIGLLGAFLAISMVLCEFYLIMNSSAVILMIGGVLKEILTILIGVIVFHDNINAINAIGCFIVFLGVILFKVSRHVAKLEAGNAPATKELSDFMEVATDTDDNRTDDDDDDGDNVSLI